ncbi:MAG TPA: glyoxylate/hydroxypyruvate reductase A [Lichenihabitans sp.]|jgi:glyoxylate/hydroxypyruvate reductase A|nr:glyoxylate/hydroxypyruvate reductase A [Lichenihabitans sp.]
MSRNDALLLVVEGRDAATPWIEAFRARLPGWRVVGLSDAFDPARVRHVAAWRHPYGSLKGLTSLDAIFSLGAGVDHLLGDPDLPPATLVRVVDSDLTARMTEWVVLHVLRHHRQAERYVRQQHDGLWSDDPLQPAAKDVRVGVMGLGVLGGDAAAKLKLLGFDVAGWSRTAKTLPGVPTFAGDGGLDAFLRRTQILVVLLPATPRTQGMLDAALIGKLARDGHLGGPVLINAGRGALQNEADILRCLDDGRLKAATLDVFETEPLPTTSPLWRHPAVTVTPHNAAISSTGAVADAVAAQILAFGRGEPLQHVVERERAY